MGPHHPRVNKPIQCTIKKYKKFTKCVNLNMDQKEFISSLNLETWVYKINGDALKEFTLFNQLSQLQEAHKGFLFSPSSFCTFGDSLSMKNVNFFLSSSEKSKKNHVCMIQKKMIKGTVCVQCSSLFT